MHIEFLRMQKNPPFCSLSLLWVSLPLGPGSESHHTVNRYYGDKQICYLSLRTHTSVCCDLEEVKLPFWLRLNWQKLAARILSPLVPLLCFPLSRAIKLSISFSFSCSSFRKKSTSTLFSFLICSLMSLGMSGIIQSTRTLRNITKFCKHSNRQETSTKNPKHLH